QKINDTSSTEQIWHLPTRSPLPKVSHNGDQKKEFTISKIPLLKSTVQYDTTTPTITTYNPRRITQSLSKTRAPQRKRFSARNTQRPAITRPTVTKTRAPLSTLKPYIPPYGTPQRTRPPQIYKSIPKVIAHTTTTSTTTTTTTTPRPKRTTTTTHRPRRITTTHRPKRNPIPRITPQQKTYQPQQYNIAVTNNTTYYSNEKPPIVSFDEDFEKSFDSFVPFKNGDEFFDTIFGAENPFDPRPIEKGTTNEPVYKSGELLYQSLDRDHSTEFFRQGSSQVGRPSSPFDKQQISFSGLRGPSILKGVTTYTKLNDTTESTPQQPQVQQHQSFQPQLREHEPKRISTAKPRYKQYINRGTISGHPTTSVILPPQKSLNTIHEQDNQNLAFEGREQIHDDFNSNRFPDYPSKLPTRTVSNQKTIVTQDGVITPQLTFDSNIEQDLPKTKQQPKVEPKPLPVNKALITSWNKQSFQQFHLGESPNSKVQSQFPRDFVPQRKASPQPTLPPLQYTTWKKHQPSHIEYQVLEQTNSSPTPISETPQTTPQYTSQPVTVTISPPHGVIIDNQFSEEPTFHLGGGYHNWEELKSTSVYMKNTTLSTTIKPTTPSTFSTNNPPATGFSTYNNFPRSTSPATIATRPPSLTETTISESYFHDVPKQENAVSFREVYEDELAPSVDSQRGTTQYEYSEDTTTPPRIQDNIEHGKIQESLRAPLSNGEQWGSKSNTNGNNLQDTEEEVPVVLVPGSSRAPSNVWTPPTPPPTSVTPGAETPKPYRRRRPGSSHRPATAAAEAPSERLAAVPRGASLGTDSSS
ncbi:unnamed protein product, partial [Meganyctiphanes norvegica]